MDCKHETVRCTNNVFYCLSCGAQVVFDADKVNVPAAQKTLEKPVATAKKAVKRKGEKEVQQ